MARLQAVYNGLTIGATSTVYNITKAQGLDGLEIRTSENLLTGSDGGNIYNSLYGMRTIAFEGNLVGSDIDDFFDKKSDFVNAFSITDSNTLVITVWDSAGTTRSIEAKVITTPMFTYENGKVNFARYRVELKCGEPFFKDETDSTYTIYLEDSSKYGGPVQSTTPMVLGGGGATNRQIITNSGDVDWYLDNIKFTGLAATPRLTNLAAGEAIYYDGTIGLANYVNITKNQSGYSATDNNGINVLANIVGDYPPILQGDNPLMFSAGSYSATASCELTWRNRYKTIY